MKIRKINPADDKRLAEIIRKNLKDHKLDIPGTAYFDSNLDKLSAYYNDDSKIRDYFVILDEDDNLLGGVGMELLDKIDNCLEMQKLYLSDEAKGRGLGYMLVSHLEKIALEWGYDKIYLETHSNLVSAIRLYEIMGYQEIERPDFVIHTSMDRFYLKRL